MIVALDLPEALAAAVEREAALHGLTPAAWLLDRLAERFGLPAHETAR